MIIRVNGEEKDVPAGTTVTGLLAALGVPTDGRAVAVNLTFVPKSRHAAQVLAAGDEVEIVAPMQGG